MEEQVEKEKEKEEKEDFNEDRVISQMSPMSSLRDDFENENPADSRGVTPHGILHHHPPPRISTTISTAHDDKHDQLALPVIRDVTHERIIDVIRMTNGESDDEEMEAMEERLAETLYKIGNESVNTVLGTITAINESKGKHEEASRAATGYIDNFVAFATMELASVLRTLHEVCAHICTTLFVPLYICVVLIVFLLAPSATSLTPLSYTLSPTRTHTHTNKHTYMHTHTNTHTHTHTHTNTQTHIHTHTYIHTHKHTLSSSHLTNRCRTSTMPLKHV